MRSVGRPFRKAHCPHCRNRRAGGRYRRLVLGTAASPPAASATKRTMALTWILRLSCVTRRRANRSLGESTRLASMPWLS